MKMRGGDYDVGCGEFCEECQQEADGHFVDFGIGPVEFWGAKSNDSDVQFVSKCCDAAMVYECDLKKDDENADD